MSDLDRIYLRVGNRVTMHITDQGGWRDIDGTIVEVKPEGYRLDGSTGTQSTNLEPVGLVTIRYGDKR